METPILINQLKSDGRYVCIKGKGVIFVGKDRVLGPLGDGEVYLIPEEVVMASSSDTVVEKMRDHLSIRKIICEILEQGRPATFEGLCAEVKKRAPGVQYVERSTRRVINVLAETGKIDSEVRDWYSRSIESDQRPQ